MCNNAGFYSCVDDTYRSDSELELFSGIVCSSKRRGYNETYLPYVSEYVAEPDTVFLPPLLPDTPTPPHSSEDGRVICPSRTVQPYSMSCGAEPDYASQRRICFCTSTFPFALILSITFLSIAGLILLCCLTSLGKACKRPLTEAAFYSRVPNASPSRAVRRNSSRRRRVGSGEGRREEGSDEEGEQKTDL